jgi:N-acyl-D-amino-acid deacylase
MRMRASIKSRRGFIFTGLLLLSALLAWWYFTPFRLDILIVNGTVADGSGASLTLGDVAIRDGKIVGISRWRFLFSRARLRLEARDRIVAPGFIDVHTHVEPNIPSSGAFLPANFLRQGVTTLITGNCGRSRVDVPAFLRELEKNGTRINLATLIGHNSVRREVMGLAARPASAAEITRMQQLVERALAGGALGLSSGLIYLPGRFATLDELVALAKTAGSQGGLYVAHIRDEGRGGWEAVREALDIGRQASTALHISHFKCSGPAQWHSMVQRLQWLDVARAAGQRVTIDLYPYERSSTTTDVLLPDWAVEENRAGLRKVATDSALRRRLHAEILQKLRQDGWPDLQHIRLAAGRQEWIGRSLAEMPKPAVDLPGQIENLIEISLRGGAQAIYADMNEADVEAALSCPYSVFGSDSAVRDPDGSYKPHPRGAGTFPRVFRRYVRDRRLLSLSQAIHKTSQQAAKIFGLAGRGALRAGAWADVVIFDVNKLEDRADYDQPFAEPAGIDYVIINGVVVVDHEALTNHRPAGMVLRH